MRDWLAADWTAPPTVRAGTTFRRGGVSQGPYATLNLGGHVGDDAVAVAENRQRLVTACYLPGEPQWLEQTHSASIIRLPHDEPMPCADAAVTERAGTVCAVLTADCLPVVFAHHAGGAVGVAHAGWRGLSAGILEATALALGKPADLVAWLGPAISRAAYEVGDEVRQAFVAHEPAAADCFAKNSAGRWQADLYALARQRLAAIGLNEVYGGGRCTFSEDEHFFSYRRDGQCGRMATFVWRE
ncbi:MAG: peptidoglycan editing factor PgeF [Woeseia sp.]|nr:peptidoglycan editing factor PgeF [Woeseia sp.]MBT8096046.1 peptidoglycan editing factor PgeF [Woeseia sp.]NNE61482.1 peptidoglycan editing factor PgeF [Woeseia sp.]NNL54465.1 peptidoglycan editing factor PgeF [Woeseia sp.]